MNTYAQLKQRVETVRSEAAAQKARVDVVEAQLAELDRSVQTTMGIQPELVAVELDKVEAEIQSLGNQVIKILGASQ